MTTPIRPAVIARWHEIVETSDLRALDTLIAEDAVFSSPAVFTPQEGKAKTFAYLGAALTVFENTGFHYVDEWYGERSAVLEFAADLDGIHVNGVDMIRWSDEDRITSFKVMIRPLKGLQALIPRMGEQLAQS
ncbi:MAG: nuclear transport factor 2 family protein [Rhodococcus sp. (in: high G+C Gram-positive bacteria)]|uniref:nuclear transport factor 2 family protein n=1 Tax=Rhodococcus sp. TaxID=1831 RepID=UPI003BAF371B